MVLKRKSVGWIGGHLTTKTLTSGNYEGGRLGFNVWNGFATFDNSILQ
jgi:hypothetical protein